MASYQAQHAYPSLPNIKQYMGELVNTRGRYAHVFRDMSRRLASGICHPGHIAVVMDGKHQQVPLQKQQPQDFT